MDRILHNLDNLLPILVFVVVVVSSWLKKRRQGGGDFENLPGGGEDRPAAPPAIPRPVKASDWEEELRRLLEGEEPVVRPKTPTPPPVVAAPQGQLPPPSRTAPHPPPLPPVAPAPQPAPVPSILPRPAVPPRPVIDETVEAPTRPLAHLLQSSQAYERASRLQDSVGTRMAELAKEHSHYYKGACLKCRGNIEFPVGAAGTTITCPHCGASTLLVIGQTTPHLQAVGIVSHSGGAKEANAAIGLLRRPESARQAMIVSFIVGPPKALET